MLDKIDISIKNKGAKIPIKNRKIALTQFISRVDNLEDLPKQMSRQCFGNPLRRQHKLFDDNTAKYDGTVSAKNFILKTMTVTSVDKKKRIDLQLSSKRTSSLNFIRMLSILSLVWKFLTQQLQMSRLK
jgi:hypothetical protein